MQNKKLQDAAEKNEIKILEKLDRHIEKSLPARMVVTQDEIQPIITLF